MLRKSLIVFVISVFLFSALALRDAYASKNHEPQAAGIEVYDANGQYLGLSQGFSMGNVIDVYVPSLSKFVQIVNNNAATGDIYQGMLLFQSYDCSGIPYVDPWRTYTIRKSGEKYYTGASTVPVEIEVHSTFYTTGICGQRSYSKYAVPAEEVPADSLPFTFPVALPLEFK